MYLIHFLCVCEDASCTNTISSSFGSEHQNNCSSLSVAVAAIIMSWDFKSQQHFWKKVRMKLYTYNRHSTCMKNTEFEFYGIFIRHELNHISWLTITFYDKKLKDLRNTHLLSRSHSLHIGQMVLIGLCKCKKNTKNVGGKQMMF